MKTYKITDKEKCSKCEEIKFLSEFYFVNKSGTKRPRPACKVCMRKDAVKNVEENKEQRLAKIRAEKFIELPAKKELECFTPRAGCYEQPKGAFMF